MINNIDTIAKVNPIQINVQFEDLPPNVRNAEPIPARINVTRNNFVPILLSIVPKFMSFQG
jgi:hypothetical protein